MVRSMWFFLDLSATLGWSISDPVAWARSQTFADTPRSTIDVSLFEGEAEMPLHRSRSRGSLAAAVRRPRGSLRSLQRRYRHRILQGKDQQMTAASRNRPREDTCALQVRGAAVAARGQKYEVVLPKQRRPASPRPPSRKRSRRVGNSRQRVEEGSRALTPWQERLLPRLPRGGIRLENQ